MTVGTSNVVIFCLSILVVVAIAALIFNKKFFKQLVIRFRGKTDEIVRQDASTPEGATAYFNDAIEEKRKLYERAEESYREISGKVSMAETDEHNLRREMIGNDKLINECLERNDENGAKVYAMKKVTLQEKLKVKQETIKEYKKTQQQQQEVRDTIKQELDELKEEKERTVYQLEADRQIISLHEGMNTSASSSENDHVLERVREGAKKTRERAVGAQVAYDTSAEGMERKMEAQERNRAADDVLAEMKRRRSNG